MVSWVTGGSHALKPGYSALPVMLCKLQFDAHEQRSCCNLWKWLFRDLLHFLGEFLFLQCERDRHFFEFYLTKIMNNSGSATAIKNSISLFIWILFIEGFTFTSLPSIFTQVTHLPMPLSGHVSLVHAFCLSCCLFICFVFLSRPHMCLPSFIFTLLWHISQPQSPAFRIFTFLCLPPPHLQTL